MGTGEFIININASRIGSQHRIISLLQFIRIFKPGVVCIQEIDVIMGTKIFKEDYQVYCNYEHLSNNYVGMITLIKKRSKHFGMFGGI